MYPTNCLVCGKKVEVYDNTMESRDETGTHPCLAGGHITIFCGYGSKFDHCADTGMNRKVIRQAIICDPCIKEYEEDQDIMRKVEIIEKRHVRWVEQARQQ